MKHFGDITTDCNLNYRVYKYNFPNGKIYIGMTKNSLEKRRDMGYQHNEKLQEAIRKYGWNGFSHEIIKDGLTRRQAEDLEIEMIKTCDTTNPEKGYNISYGGRATFAGLKHTNKYKEKMCRINKGKKFSEMHLRKLKLAQEKTSMKVIGIDEKENKFAFNSLHDAAKSVDGYATNISRAIESKKIYKGLLWKKIADEKGGDEGETLR